MPQGDKTGPLGEGRMTGRKMGLCVGNDTPGFTGAPGRNVPGAGGFGRGKGYGRRGGGFGFRWRFGWNDPKDGRFPGKEK